MLPAEFTFDPTEPWVLQLLVQRVIGAKDKAWVTFDLGYTLPDGYIKREPAAPASAHGRKKQVLDAVRAAADELSNTPAICRKSYVHDTIVTAFEDGILERFAATMKGYRTQAKREALLAQVVTAAAA